MEKTETRASGLLQAIGVPPLPRPRRRLAAPPPSAADPAPWLQALSPASIGPAEVRLLMRMARRRAVAAGDPIWDSRLGADALVLLVSGDAVLGSRAPDGQLRTERSVVGPAWLDITAAWLREPFAMEAQALSDAVVAELPLAELRQQMQLSPLLAQQMCEVLARQVQELTLASRNLLHNDASARLAQWLLQRCPVDSGAVQVRLQERKRDIAQQLAMSPETLSRLMRAFELRGVLGVRGYLIDVPDVGQLRSIAAGG